MKKLLIIIALFPIILLAQKDYRARLPILGGFDEFGVSPSEKIWIATKAGNVYKTSGIDSLWHLGPFGSLDPYSLGLSETFERINFFSEDILMISGYMSGDDMSYNFVYRSENRGKDWEKVVFGKGSWIDAAYVSKDGKSWMSGSSQLIYYTQDYGKTWQEFDKVEKSGNLRFNAIHFAPDGLHGLFGSTWNVIYRTKDNCKTWEQIPTPLGQKKIKWVTTNRNDQPRIDKIRVLNNRYIAKQQGKVCYTNSDRIDWTVIENAIDFEITDDGELYIVNRDCSVSLLDHNLNHKWDSKERVDPYCVLAVQNGSLFAVNHASVYKINEREFIHNGLFTTDIKIGEPDITINWKSETIGLSDRDILRFNYPENAWYRSMILPSGLSGLFVYEGNLLTTKNLDSYYKINLQDNSVEEYRLPEQLFDISKQPVHSFSIESGSQGCFHSELQVEKYVRNGNIFSKTKNDVGRSLGLSKEKPASIINSILGEINNTKPKTLSVKELGITLDDIKRYKQDIRDKIKKKEGGWDHLDLKTFPGEDTDYDFYLNIVDSLEAIPDSVFTKIFDSQSTGFWSTTTNWIKLSITLENNDSITISNREYQPNYYYSPWIVTYNDLRLKCISFELGKLIDKLSEGKILSKEVTDKKYALFRIADYLYWKSLKED